MAGNFIVSGGAGFIGSHIAKRLLNEGNKVLIIDNLSTGDEKNLPKGAEFAKLDITKNEEIEKIPKGYFDGVFHLAAQSSGEISYEKPNLDLVSNAVGTHNMLRWCKKNGVKRFLHASSMAVYGNPKKLPVGEDAPCGPISFYGISKFTAEQYVMHYFREGMHTTIFRMFSVYGPGQNLQNMKQGMASIYLAYMLEGKQVLVKGSKERFRDLIYIDDVVDAWMAALGNEKSYGKIYNLGCGKKVLVKEIVKAELEALGLGENYPVKYEGSTPADQFGLYANVNMIKNELGWEPKVGFEEGIKKYVEYCRKQKK